MREDDETDIDFARRVFSTIKANFKYDYRAEMDRRASVVCEDKQSDCGGLSVLFVSTLRANNIPARVLVGRWAVSSKPGQAISGVGYHQTHVKAEFFADDIGWVPVDMSSAILHDARGDGTQFFGRDRGDFLTMHIDPEVVINTIHFGRKQTPWLQGVTFWVTGQGNLEKLTTQETWVVRQIKADNDEPLSTKN
jgi:transglutaminase-like putative cysteine protease